MFKGQFMNLVVLLGTRPEAIKLAPVILELKKRSNLRTLVVSTGQHQEMMAPILELFSIEVDVDLKIMNKSRSLADLTIQAMSALEDRFNAAKISGIVVQGDTASCMAASLWAFLHKVPVFHVEAGLRTGDLSAPWPEEFNRRVTGLASTLHFAPTLSARHNLLREGVDSERVFVVGNTVIDALKIVCGTLDCDRLLNERLARDFSFLNPARKLILATVHRRENFGQGLEDIFRAFTVLAQREDVQIVLPLHKNPVVREAAARGLKDSNVVVIDPQSYIDFVYLMRRAELMISDSGGIQEEALYLRKPVLVLRESTERPESVSEGACKLIGTNKDVIVSEAVRVLEGLENMALRGGNPYGQGDSAKQIIDEVEKYYGVVGSGREALPELQV